MCVNWRLTTLIQCTCHEEERWLLYICYDIIVMMITKTMITKIMMLIIAEFSNVHNMMRVYVWFINIHAVNFTPDRINFKSAVTQKIIPGIKLLFYMKWNEDCTQMEYIFRRIVTVTCERAHRRNTNRVKTHTIIIIASSSSCGSLVTWIASFIITFRVASERLVLDDAAYFFRSCLLSTTAI